MDYKMLADLLFSDLCFTVDYWEEKYPQRQLQDGAKVTRIAPSPTGFMHLGNLYGAMIDERLAHQSNGIFYLRIEDTDQKREVPGAVAQILDTFSDYDLNFDEGALKDGDSGQYGPYRQRERAEIYQTFAKYLVEQGKAYPCFCTEDELANIRQEQMDKKDNFGYFGEYTKCRNLSLEDIKHNIQQNKPYVIRYKSEGSLDKKVKFTDLVKGNMEFPENNQDVVILKSDGIPTYHFAHVVDDHLMRTTHVVRGEEWLATLPIHLQLFQALGWKAPKYIHTTHLLKMDGESKRKLSKRKDPELALSYYKEQGYSKDVLKEYIMTLLNSNFEDWRIANPNEDINKFPFSIKKMSVSGALFDINKLRDISKNVLSRLTAEQVLEQLLDWAKVYNTDFADVLNQDLDYAKNILSINRGGKKPRKDLVTWSETPDYMSFFYDEMFKPQYIYPQNVSNENIKLILTKYQDLYNQEDDSSEWFNKIKQLTEEIGFASNMKEYKANPENYAGNVADVSMVIRIAVTGKENSPDLDKVMNIMGKDKVLSRLKLALENL